MLWYTSSLSLPLLLLLLSCLRPSSGAAGLVETSATLGGNVKKALFAKANATLAVTDACASVASATALSAGGADVMCCAVIRPTSCPGSILKVLHVIRNTCSRKLNIAFTWGGRPLVSAGMQMVPPDAAEGVVLLTVPVIWRMGDTPLSPTKGIMSAQFSSICAVS